MNAKQEEEEKNTRHQTHDRSKRVMEIFSFVILFLLNTCMKHLCSLAAAMGVE